jgi:hypothetical protein
MAHIHFSLSITDVVVRFNYILSQFTKNKNESRSSSTPRNSAAGIVRLPFAGTASALSTSAGSVGFLQPPSSHHHSHVDTNKHVHQLR